MSAVADLFFDQGEGQPPNSPLRGAQRLFGTVYFAFKPESEPTAHAVGVGDRLRARHRLTGKVSPDVLHVTLCATGRFPDLSEEYVEKSLKLASCFVAKPFEIIFDRARTYPNGTDQP